MDNFAEILSKKRKGLEVKYGMEKSTDIFIEWVNGFCMGMDVGKLIWRTNEEKGTKGNDKENKIQRSMGCQSD